MLIVHNDLYIIHVYIYIYVYCSLTIFLWAGREGDKWRGGRGRKGGGGSQRVGRDRQTDRGGGQEEKV